MRKPRALGKAAGSHKLKKAQLSSDSSDEDDDIGDIQVCQCLITHCTCTIISTNHFGYSACLTGC